MMANIGTVGMQAANMLGAVSSTTAAATATASVDSDLALQPMPDASSVIEATGATIGLNRFSRSSLGPVAMASAAGVATLMESSAVMAIPIERFPPHSFLPPSTDAAVVVGGVVSVGVLLLLYNLITWSIGDKKFEGVRKTFKLLLSLQERRWENVFLSPETYLSAAKGSEKRKRMEDILLEVFYSFEALEDLLSRATAVARSWGPLLPKNRAAGERATAMLQIPFGFNGLRASVAPPVRDENRNRVMHIDPRNLLHPYSGGRLLSNYFDDLWAEFQRLSQSSTKPASPGEVSI